MLADSTLSQRGLRQRLAAVINGAREERRRSAGWVSSSQDEYGVCKKPKSVLTLHHLTHQKPWWKSASPLDRQRLQRAERYLPRGPRAGLEHEARHAFRRTSFNIEPQFFFFFNLQSKCHGMCALTRLPKNLSHHRPIYIARAKHLTATVPVLLPPGTSSAVRRLSS